eukprot:6176480-Pleurochrysis_carterae.AAC.2
MAMSCVGTGLFVACLISLELQPVALFDGAIEHMYAHVLACLLKLLCLLPRTQPVLVCAACLPLLVYTENKLSKDDVVALTKALKKKDTGVTDLSMKGTCSPDHCVWLCETCCNIGPERRVCAQAVLRFPRNALGIVREALQHLIVATNSARTRPQAVRSVRGSLSRSRGWRWAMRA